MAYFLVLAACAAGDLTWWVVVDRRVRPLRGRRVWRLLLAAFMATQLGYLLPVAAGFLPTIGLVGWPIAAYLWHILILPMALLGLLCGTLWRAARARWRPSPRGHGADAAEPLDLGAGAMPAAALDPEAQNSSAPAGPTRREVLATAVAAVVPPVVLAGASAYAGGQLGTFRVSRVELPVPGLPPDLDGLTIAHVTDLHIGTFLPRGTAERVADVTNALAADLVAFTGDLLDHSARDVRPGIDFLRRLDPRHGLGLIEGNHDLTFGTEWFERPLRDAGLPLLLDESLIVRVPGRATPVQFLGITWGELRPGRELGRYGRFADVLFRDPSKEARRDSVRRVAARRLAGAFPILLAHHPHAFDPAAAAGLPLVLSGHTHGGQLMLTRSIGAGPLRFRYWSGLYRKPGSNLFISNGVGNWFPLRINAPAEVVHLTLRRYTGT